MNRWTVARKLIFLSLAVLFWLNWSIKPTKEINYGSGTALVVVRSAASVLAAVDSKETWREYRDGQWSSEERQVCKAATVGPYYAMVAGLDRGTGFDALAETAAAWRPGDNIETLASNAVGALSQSLGRLFDSLQSADPVEFGRRYARETALQIALFGVEKRTPEVIVLQFLGDRSRRVTHCPGDCPAQRSTFFLGTHDKIDETTRRNSSLIAHLDARNIAALIDLEREDRPDVVGGPVSVVRVTAAGAELVQAGACQ